MTKIHAAVNENGMLLGLALTGRRQHASLTAGELLAGMPSGGMLLADKAYDSDPIRQFVRARGTWANIPPRQNRRDPICFSPYLYRDRNQAERFFNRIKHYRRIATRYEKRAVNFLAFVKLAAIPLWLRVYESTA